MLRGSDACTAFVAAVALLATTAVGAEQASADRYLAAVAQDLPLQARETLPHIDGIAHQLLATRSYLRVGPSLSARWSWSEKEIRAYTGTAEYRDLLTQVAAVQERFSAQNPGYSLYANTQTRSLDLQLERWNANPSVTKLAERLRKAALHELEAGRYPATPSAATTERFAEFLRSWRPPIAAPLAAPGLSLHGRARAIDFQVVSADRIVAPIEMAKVISVWERQGWARKLQAAVAGTSFVGPLRSPNEPWHYEYVPGARQKE